MKNMMQYKDYAGSVEYSAEDGLLFGKVQFIRASISYEGTDAASLKEDFQAAVDDYLDLCATRGVAPEQPFKGSFNVRVGTDLHRKLSIEARQRGVSLNSLVSEKLEQRVG
ncbi:MAG: type II toxin-antitoxin system HicB family antitoxin [Methylophilaceae bacterium]